MSHAIFRRRLVAALVGLCIVFYFYGAGGQVSARAVSLDRPIFNPGEVKKGYKYRKALIVASVQGEDTSWIAEELPEVDAYVYVNDDPSANLTVPRNKGREVMTYLTFIIDHYEKLPEISIFVHSHREAYHNPWLLNGAMPDIVRALNPARVIRHGYVNTHCGDGNNMCRAKVRPADGMPYEENRQAWTELFPQYTIPKALVQMPAAQFAVSRERIREIPKSDFVRYRQWMLDTKIHDKTSGFIFEFLWQFIFRGDHIFCPRPNVCYCDGFGICMEEDDYHHFDKTYVTAEGLAEQIRHLDNQGDLSRDDQIKRDRYSQAEDDLRNELYRMKEEAEERGRDPAVRARAAEYV